MEPVKIKELLDSVLRLQTITQKTAPRNIQQSLCFWLNNCFLPDWHNFFIIISLSTV